MKAENVNPPIQPSRMNREEFVQTFGGVYEHSQWIAKAVFASGVTEDHDTISGIHGALRNVVDTAHYGRQLALLRAHPDLVGKMAVAGRLTTESKIEQASAQLDHCTVEEFEEFQALNDRYKNIYKFPYILAVRGRNRQEILENFRSRMGNDTEVEFAEALKQVHRIALLRVQALFKEERA